MSKAREQKIQLGLPEPETMRRGGKRASKEFLLKIRRKVQQRGGK